MFEAIVLSLIFDIVVITISFFQGLYALAVAGIAVLLYMGLTFYKLNEEAKMMHEHSVTKTIDLRGMSEDERKKVIESSLREIFEEDDDGGEQ